MFAVGNDELGDNITKGDLVAYGTMQGVVKYGVDESGNEDSILGFISVDGVCYLVSINNKLLPGVIKL